MKSNLIEQMSNFANLFDTWADAIFENADKEFIQDNYAENKLYRIISNSFQQDGKLYLEDLRKSDIYKSFQENIDQWGELYQNRFMQSRKGAEIIANVVLHASTLLPQMYKDEYLMKYYGKTISELVEIRSLTQSEFSESELESLLLRTFNLIEKAYVELAYSLIDEEILKNKIDEEQFWEEPIMEYVMETWWPKRRVYRNRILLIDISKFPQEMKFDYKNFMSDKFYGCGIFGFLKQLRNQLTHVKTSGYHEKLTKELFTKEFLNYWCQMNTSIAIYIISYLSTN
jgi:hypothetical protein